MHNPRYLAELGLVNTGLVALTPTLIERYNKALISMGIAPTTCHTVYIDGVGWSPQVAEEKRDLSYLCNGPINPSAIIISPDQFKKPVYMPAFSWMRSVMRLVFETYHREIIDITSSDVVILDFETGLSSLENPMDLPLLSCVIVKPYTGELVQRAMEQQALITRFMEGLNCLEADVRDALIEHRQKYGDLCKRKFFMQELTYPLARDFWTAALGGAAVIRNVDGQDMLFLEDKAAYEAAQRDERSRSVHLSYLYDIGAGQFELLSKAGMIVLPTESFRTDPNILEVKKELLLALTIGACEPDFDWRSASPSLRKHIVQVHADKIPAIYRELERFAAVLRAGGATLDISRDLWYYLATPSDALPPGTREVLWILLTRKEPRNVLESYTRDKNRFLVWYEALSDAAQKWVAAYLKEHYVPHMNR